MLTFTINDMTCGHCVGSITKAIQALDPAAKIAVDLTTHTLSVQSQSDAQAIQECILEAGYTPQRQ
jgi:copper chaperone CopZ